jgi:hypothetical protein
LKNLYKKYQVNLLPTKKSVEIISTDFFYTCLTASVLNLPYQFKRGSLWVHPSVNQLPAVYHFQFERRDLRENAVLIFYFPLSQKKA